MPVEKGVEQSESEFQDVDWLSALGEMIRDSDEPVALEQVINWADQLEADYQSVADLQRKLTRTFKEVTFSRSSSTFIWSAAAKARSTAAEPVSLLEMIRSWVKADGTEQSRIASEIREFGQGSSKQAGAVELSIALGITSGEVTWSELSAEDCLTAGALPDVMLKAPLWWCLGAAVTLPTKSAGGIRKYLQSQPESDRIEAAALLLEQWYSEPIGQDVSQKVRRLGSALGVQPGGVLLGTAIQHALLFTSDRKRSTDLLVLTSLITESAWEELQAALKHANAMALQRLLEALAHMKCPELERSKLILAVACSDHSEALLSETVFMGLSLDVIGGLLAEKSFRRLIESGLDGYLAGAIHSATPSKLGLALAPVATHAHLAPLMPIGLLGKLMKSGEASASVARQAAQELIEEVLEAERERCRHEIDILLDKLSDAEDARLQSEKDITAHSRRADEAEDRLRRAVSSSVSVSTGELRQAQLDVLRSLVDHAVSLGDARSVADSELLRDLEESLEKQLLEFDVRSIGQRGERVVFDPALHEPIDVEVGTEVELVRPAYVISDSVTPLRYGLARKI